MTEDPACCTRETPLQDVAQKMIDGDCGCIPVVADEKSRELVGVISDRDIVCRAVAQGKDPTKTTAGDCMSKEVVTVTPEADLDECCQTIERNQVRRVPVVDDDGCCCGIVSQADIAERTDPPHAASVVKEVSHHTTEASRVGCC